MSLRQIITLLFEAFGARRRYRKSMENLRFHSNRHAGITGVLEAYRQGDYEGALHAADKLENVDPGGYNFFRGSMLMQLDRLDEAEKHLRRCVSLRQEGSLAAIAHTSLGLLLLERKRFEEALKYFNAALQFNPDRGAHVPLYRGCVAASGQRGRGPEMGGGCGRKRASIHRT
jgi:tetratricopeptide (TPR) repeat protein